MASRSVRVLHVDDLEEEFILARELLSSVPGIDFEFQWVSDVRIAAQTIRSGNFDVCLVDYYLGMDNGLDFIRKSIESGIKIPFILMSGQKDHAIDREALKIGVHQCVDKNNITTSILLNAIQDATKITR